MTYELNDFEQASESLVATQVHVAGELLQLTIADVPVNFRWAPGGRFMMGSPVGEKGREEDEFQYVFELPQGFWIAETLMTQEFWQAVMGYNPSNFNGSHQLPVESVSWYTCRDFVKKLNSYYAYVLPDGFKFSLPTEAQWEYACRAGSTTPFNFGDSLNGDQANCNGKKPYGTKTKGVYLKATTPVKSYPGNLWGLYDMHGNVWEWTSYYDKDFVNGSVSTIDPSDADSGSFQTLRGGSWNCYARFCRSAYRRYIAPDSSDNDVGFRLVLVSNTQSPGRFIEDGSSRGLLVSNSQRLGRRVAGRKRNVMKPTSSFAAIVDLITTVVTNVLYFLYLLPPITGLSGSICFVIVRWRVFEGLSVKALFWSIFTSISVLVMLLGNCVFKIRIFRKK